MIVILAEKPSVGKDIARVLGVTHSKKGYMEGNGYIVTWAYGHLVSLAMPEDYRAEKYSREDLPILPEPFRLIPRKIKSKTGYQTDETALEQLKLIGKLFDKCERIVVATDAGREGELIFRFIYHYLECSKPFSRLWISSLTDTAIGEGLNNLKDGKEYNSLFLAAEARSKADWMVGINASRALSFCTGDNNNSLGRVQTPTLAMICKRYSEHSNFKPQPFWELLIHIVSEKQFYVTGTTQYFDLHDAEKMYQLLKLHDHAKVVKVEKKNVTEQAPLLHDLASLQKAANTKYGYSADKTLSVAQRLYEQKYITYPRTGSRYIPDDVFETISALLEALRTYSAYSKQAESLSNIELNNKSVNGEKVTDHHALLITGIIPDNLNEMDKHIYDLIAGRTIEAFSKPCLKDTTVIDLDCGGIEFRTKGSVIVEKGWRSVCDEPEEQNEKEENQILPDLGQGDTVPVQNHNMIQKKTKPKPLYTDASLLTAMETAGKELEDQQAREVLKGLGIGTPATRAATIEVLLSRGYITREKKNLIPTNKGMEIHKAVKSMRIADVEMTGSWELAINRIEAHPDYYDTFLEGMKIHTKQMTDEIISVNLNKENYLESPYICPKCKLGKMVFYPKIVRCNNSVCKHILYRKKNEVVLNDEQLSQLFKKGRTGRITGFKNRYGQPFEASLTFDEAHNLMFDFSDPKTKGNGKRKKT